MEQNIVEYLRECVIKQILSTSSVEKAWPTWHEKIKEFAPDYTADQVFDLGDHLKDIFNSTNTGGRSQSSVSVGGACWEALVCWYLNLCLIGRRTVVIKHNESFLPSCVSDAITVNYGTFPSNTESDLIAITFPEKDAFVIDKELIEVRDIKGTTIKTHKKGKKKTYNLLKILDALCMENFNDLEIHIIQCKTNWNDNAQIPMLWDAVYSAISFKSDVYVGKNGYSIGDVAKFTYSFVTVPSGEKAEKYNKDSTAVLRVKSLSGGNYWGKTSLDSVAYSIKEMLARNLKSGHNANHRTTIRTGLSVLDSIYKYFGL